MSQNSKLEKDFPTRASFYQFNLPKNNFNTGSKMIGIDDILVPTLNLDPNMGLARLGECYPVE